MQLCADYGYDSCLQDCPCVVWDEETSLDEVDSGTTSDSCCSPTIQEFLDKDSMFVPLSKEFISDFLLAESGILGSHESVRAECFLECEPHKSDEVQDFTSSSVSRSYGMADESGIWVCRKDAVIKREPSISEIQTPIKLKKRIVSRSCSQFTLPLKRKVKCEDDNTVTSPLMQVALVEPPSTPDSELSTSEFMESSRLFKRSRQHLKSTPPPHKPTIETIGSNILKVESLKVPAGGTVVDSAVKEVPMILLECKFLSKRSGFRCPCTPALTSHKRGHLSASCRNGHQWVWCQDCCNCEGKDRRGCRQKAHWFERDAFDTGRRNHMRTAHGRV